MDAPERAARPRASPTFILVLFVFLWYLTSYTIPDLSMIESLQQQLHLRERQKLGLERWWADRANGTAWAPPPPKNASLDVPDGTQGKKEEEDAKKANETDVDELLLDIPPSELAPLLLPQFREPASYPSEPVLPPPLYYHNVTGFFKGFWAARNFFANETGVSSGIPGGAGHVSAPPKGGSSVTHQWAPTGDGWVPSHVRTVGERARNVSLTGETGYHNISNTTETSDVQTLEERRGTFPWTFSNASAFSLPQDRWPVNGWEGKKGTGVGGEDLGKVSFNVREEPLLGDEVAVLRGSLDLISADRSTTADLRIDGLHFVRNGSFYLVGVPQDRSSPTDIRQVLALVPPDLPTLNISVAAIEEELDNRIERIQRAIDKVDTDDSSGAFISASPANCTFLIASHLHALDPNKLPLPLPLLEAEILNPSGILGPVSSASSLPRLLLSSTMWSPDCELVVDARSAEGLRMENFWRKTTRYAGALAAAGLMTAWVTVRQMEHTRTPSGLAKLSFYSFGCMAFADGYTWITHLIVAIVSDNNATLPLLGPSFLYCILFLAFNLRYAMLIFHVQLPEQRAAAPQTTSETPQTPAAPPSGGGTTMHTSQPNSSPESAPLEPPPRNTEESQARRERMERAQAEIAAPAENAREEGESRDDQLDPLLGRSTVEAATAIPPMTPPPPPTDVNVPGTLMAHIQIPYFVFTVVGAITLIIFFPWPIETLVIPILFSFWLPQIYRNAKRGSRRGLTWEFIFFTSAARLFLPLYIYACPRNVLFQESNDWIWLVALWVSFQALMLFAQDMLGPRFFIPRRFQPASTTWDWHPPLPMPDPEAPSQPLGECAICLDPIFDSDDVTGAGGDQGAAGSSAAADGSEKGSSALDGLLGTGFGLRSRRRNVMVAPCHHIFHTGCLERWLSIKQECPSCRRVLPPI